MILIDVEEYVDVEVEEYVDVEVIEAEERGRRTLRSRRSRSMRKLRLRRVEYVKVEENVSRMSRMSRRYRSRSTSGRVEECVDVEVEEQDGVEDVEESPSGSSWSISGSCVQSRGNSIVHELAEGNR